MLGCRPALIRSTLLALAGLLALPVAGHAAETAAFTSPQSSVTLLSEPAAIAPSQPFRLGLRQKLSPGWHTYWSNPGDAGEPPSLGLDLPAGSSSGELQFPAPERIEFGPLVNFGYENEVVFPVTVTPPADLLPGDTFTVRADAFWLVCADICIPEETSFTLALPVEPAARADAATAPRFAAADASLPRPSIWQAEAGFEGEGGVLRLSGDLLSPDTVAGAFFFPAEWGLIENAAPQELRVGQGELSLGLVRAKGELPERLRGVIAVTDAAGSRSTYALDTALGPVPPTASAAAAGLPLWQATLLAALGGLLLNLMPCVFPILAMKAVGIAALAGREDRTIRGHALAYVAGVLLSFLALAGLLLMLKGAGLAAGWGFQFTSPLFVAAMAWLMLAVGLNLSGVYAMAGPVGAGSGLAAKGGHAGSFFTGALAVLVATPCTAPFMAAAVGAAFVMPPAATLAVFGALGLGMGLPYALLAFLPRLARLLPRPGLWMERLKQALAFPMYGTAGWLAWVLTVQAGADGLLLALVGALLTAFAAWALGVAQRSGRRGTWVGGGLAGLAMLAALAVLPQLRAGDVPVAAALEAATAEPWSEARVAELRAEGRPVFVNLTAAWCITCKVNERMALDTAATREAFAAAGVATLVGDWTNGDPAIGALLRRHGREGVPLYLLYPAGSGAPVVLPQILTETLVLQALEPIARTAAKVPAPARS